MHLPHSKPLPPYPSFTTITQTSKATKTDFLGKYKWRANEGIITYKTLTTERYELLHNSPLHPPKKDLNSSLPLSQAALKFCFL